MFSFVSYIHFHDFKLNLFKAFILKNKVCVSVNKDCCELQLGRNRR